MVCGDMLLSPPQPQPQPPCASRRRSFIFRNVSKSSRSSGKRWTRSTRWTARKRRNGRRACWQSIYQHTRSLSLLHFLSLSLSPPPPPALFLFEAYLANRWLPLERLYLTPVTTPSAQSRPPAGGMAGGMGDSQVPACVCCASSACHIPGPQGNWAWIRSSPRSLSELKGNVAQTTITCRFPRGTRTAS